MRALDLAIQRAGELVAAGAIAVDPADRVYPCVCGCPRDDHGGTRNAGKCAQTDTCGCSGRYRFNKAWELAYEAVDGQNREWTDEMSEWDRRDRAEWLRENPKKPGTVSVGASDIGNCRAKIGFRERPPADFYRSPEDTRDATMGSIIHAEVTARWKDLYPWRIIEEPFKMPGFDRSWRPDSYDPITAEIEDLKTAGDWRWDIVTEHGPDEDTWDQGFLYGLLLRSNGYEVRSIRITYAWRHKGHSWSFRRDYDDDRARAALDRLLTIATELDFLPEDGMLPRDRPGPTTDGLCRRCWARDYCWNLRTAEEIGRSGESLTHLGMFPEEPELAWAGQRAIEARDARLAAEKAEAEAMALIDGVQPGEYGEIGEVVIDEKFTGGAPNYKGYVERVQDWKRLPEDARPPIEDITLDRFEKRRKTAVKRLAKAERLKREKALAKAKAAEAAAAADVATEDAEGVA